MERHRKIIDRFDQFSLDAALRAGRVGIWEWDIAHDRVKICPITAEMFGLQGDELKPSFKLDELVVRMHPHDQSEFHRQIAPALVSGGLFMAHYRTMPALGEVRRVTGQGIVELDENGHAERARGIAMNAVSNWIADDSLPIERESPIERLARVALEAWRALDPIDKADREDIEPVIRALLIVLGRKLATTVQEEPRVLEVVKMFLHS